ncbi:hypothetical protein GOBAR_DD01490 [Gossypium barbadense]|nr:hypothetical protein GOBAR_DD01490 [Gossypium barbadense]
MQKKKKKRGNRETINESPTRLVRRKLMDSLSPCKAVADPNQRNRSWDILKKVGRSVKETWIVKVVFNAIFSEVEKEAGHRKSRASMDEFSDVIEELSLVDIKEDKGWFTWVNNREGNAMVKERLDRFLISASDGDNFPFIETRVVRQSNLDHDAIILDTMGQKPHDSFRDPRLTFKYDVCWAKVKDAKNIIKNAWSGNNLDNIKKIERVGQEPGQW